MEDEKVEKVSFEEVRGDDAQKIMDLYTLNEGYSASLTHGLMNTSRFELYEEGANGRVMLARLRNYEPNFETRLHATLSKFGTLAIPQNDVHLPSPELVGMISRQLNDMLDIMNNHYGLPKGYNLSILPGVRPKPILSFSSESKGVIDTFVLNEWSFDRNKVIEPLIDKVRKLMDYYSPKTESRVEALKHDLKQVGVKYDGIGLSNVQLASKLHSVLIEHDLGEKVLPVHLSEALESGISLDVVSDRVGEVATHIWLKEAPLPEAVIEEQKMAVGSEYSVSPKMR
jgi:hypothetical protein